MALEGVAGVGVDEDEVGERGVVVTNSNNLDEAECHQVNNQVRVRWRQWTRRYCQLRPHS